MKKIRVISRLDIKGLNVVKAVQTEGLHVVGNPKEMAYNYYSQGADEILYLDIVASLYGRNIDYDLLKSVAKDIFIPFTVGGGIRNIEGINQMLQSGADKVAINTYALQNPEFIAEAVKKFGSQCVVLSVDAKKRGHEKWEAFSEGGREPTGKDVVEWVKQGIKLGVGEILISSIDRDGTRKGYDMELIKKIGSFSSVPVIAHGGAKDLKSMEEAIIDAKVDAISASSIYHYKDFSIKEVKDYLDDRNIKVRLI